MNATQREKNIYGSDVEIIYRDFDCTIYRLSDETGNIEMKSYTVFPGIELIYNDVHKQECLLENSKPENIFEINHCREGRIECEFKDEFCYLTPGDLSIAYKSNMEHGSYFPLGHYQGISIIIDMEKVPQCFSCFLDDVNVSPSILIKKFCQDNKGFIARSEPSIEHIFSELYSVPDRIKKGYFKVKILELFLFLSNMEVNTKENEKQCVSKSQVSLAKNICKYLTEHMESHVTLDQLSEIFHISGTQIKNSFKAVYGVSMYSYIRTQKMQSAALLLKKNNCKVIEIAGRFGYDNGSKFAKAFKDIMGVTPNEYRTSK